MVSAVGAQSTTTTSHSPDVACCLMSARANTSSRPGMTESSSASRPSTPAQAKTSFSHPWISCQDSSMRSCASSCWPERVVVIGETIGPRGTSKASASECAGSVDSTMVRRPASAQRNAVAAAVVVLPTPPLPVNSRIRASPGIRRPQPGGVADPSGGTCGG